MARTDPQFNVRMPAELKEKLVRMAESRNRSINAEIISAIEAAVQLHELTEGLHGTEYITTTITVKDPRVIEQPDPAHSSEDFLRLMLEKLNDIEKKIDNKE
ncbi:hypothetical protein BIY29_05365 [Brenneria alni]|uniref:Arc-like DNA binding domain-containing protein n=1 Tax=Brenneria alni TaxID=71656 RepID=A0A421DQY6_9GAMM|nr:Arc family DNA-binding protein [Brenneria alni]RLM26490.1 hypothetical protein BIY29_05365 [Brenneria alni]